MQGLSPPLDTRRSAAAVGAEPERGQQERHVVVLRWVANTKHDARLGVEALASAGPKVVIQREMDAVDA